MSWHYYAQEIRKRKKEQNKKTCIPKLMKKNVYTKTASDSHWNDLRVINSQKMQALWSRKYTNTSQLFTLKLVNNNLPKRTLQALYKIKLHSDGAIDFMLRVMAFNDWSFHDSYTSQCNLALRVEMVLKVCSNLADIQISISRGKYYGSAPGNSR